jgi:hypothetical protein
MKETVNIRMASNVSVALRDLKMAGCTNLPVNFSPASAGFFLGLIFNS